MAWREFAFRLPSTAIGRSGAFSGFFRWVWKVRKVRLGAWLLRGLARALRGCALAWGPDFPIYILSGYFLQGFVALRLAMDMRRAARQSLAMFENAVPALKWDVKRALARVRSRGMARAAAKGGGLPRRLHIGCGGRRVPGWLNCDVSHSEVNIDLAGGRLPFGDGVFEAACAQHVIEHLSIRGADGSANGGSGELEGLLGEVHRCQMAGGELWLSCPDMHRIAASYLADGGAALLADRLSRWPQSGTGGYPASQVVNLLFSQWGEHKNLFDLPLLRAVLEGCGFGDVEAMDEARFLARFPEFPPRGDDAISLYVRAYRR